MENERSTIDKDKAADLFRQADKCLNANDVPSAIECINGAIYYDRGCGRYYKLRANIIERLGHFGPALQDYDEAIKLDPALIAGIQEYLRQPDFVRRFVDAQIGRGDPKFLVKWLRQVAGSAMSGQMENVFCEAFSDVATYYLSLGRLSEAAELIRQIDTSCVFFPRLPFLARALAAQSGDVASVRKANEQLGADCEASLALAIAHYRSGLHSLERGHLTGVLLSLSASLESASNFAPALAKRAGVLLELGRINQAREDVERLVALGDCLADPALGDVDLKLTDLWNLVCSLRDRSLLDEAARCCKFGLSIDAHHVANFDLFLAEIELSRGNHSAVIDLCNGALERDRNDPAALFFRGSSLRRIGEHALAISDLRRALEVEPHSAFVGVELSKALEAMQK